MGRDATTSNKPRGTRGFNPRARVGRDAKEFAHLVYTFKFQSTRPRGARLCRRAMYQPRQNVSIHAPAWGATSMLITPIRPPKFQSTRPRGARLRAAAAQVPYDGFNPRARVGRDGRIMRVAPVISVSIHAPAWGATKQSKAMTTDIKFQSTRPRGARPIHDIMTGYSSGFNPRARVGRDLLPRFGRQLSD